MILRDYQHDCHDAILGKLRDHRSTLAVLATGLGKTIIFAYIVKSRLPGRSLILAHRQELIWQAREKIEKATGMIAEVEMAELSARPSLFGDYPVVASIQTLISGNGFKRMGRFKPEDFSTLIIDEAHHSTSKSYVQIIDYFKQNPNLKILGVTATPDRADKEALGQIFETTAFQYEILDGIENGWLVDVTQMFYQVESLDFSHCRTTAGDLNGADLGAVMEDEEIVLGVCQPTLEVMFALPPKTLSAMPPPEWNAFLTKLGRTPRRTIMFTASVAQAKSCYSVFNRAMPGIAEWVCGKTKKEDRVYILENFQSGRTALVANCGVLTEGFDNPGVEVIVMARPTKSRALYAQMVGRSTRPLPGLVDKWPTASERKLAIALSGKPFCRVIDFCGNTGRHRLMTSMDILGGKVSDDVVQRSILDAIKSGKPVRVCRTLTQAEINLEREKRKAAAEWERLQEERRKKVLARSKFTYHKVNPFDREFQGAGLEFTHRPHWRSLSEKQRTLLRSRGYNPDRMSPQQGRVLIGVIAKREGWKR
jgi:superfamily II DNA or RNA helicase